MNEVQPITDTNEEVSDKDISRAQFLHKGGQAGMSLISRLASISVPLAVASAAKAHAQDPSPLIAVLNFALTLEYLEDEFYRTGLAGAVAGSLSPAERNAIEQISKHETAHVGFITAVIKQLQGTPVAKPTFDFTAKGTFPDVFSNKATFLAIAQTLEDTGVRAYKGQAGNVMSNATVLTASLQIHSVEARHAAQIRRLRGQKAWITNNSRGDLPAAAQATYDGEENTTHNNANAAPLGANFGGNDAVSEAFDEPLTMDQVLNIAKPFIV